MVSAIFYFIFDFMQIEICGLKEMSVSRLIVPSISASFY